MKVFTQEEFDSFPIVNDVKQCPTGDYTQINVFDHQCNFEANCVFDKGGIFKQKCVFGNYCTFKVRSLFYSETFEFEEPCVFGKRCSIGKGTVFRETCTFGEYCEFKMLCLFAVPCNFGAHCKFGKKCHFEEDCKFDIKCTFKQCCEFGYYSSFENNLGVGNKILNLKDDITNKIGLAYKLTNGIYIRYDNFLGTLKEFEKSINNININQEHNKLLTTWVAIIRANWSC